MPNTDEQFAQKFPKFSDFPPELREKLINTMREKLPVVVDDSIIVDIISAHIETTREHFHNIF